MTQTIADTDARAARALRTPAHELFDQIESFFGEIEYRISSLNAPGAASKLRQALYAQIDNKGGSRPAKAIFDIYTNK